MGSEKTIASNSARIKTKTHCIKKFFIDTVAQSKSNQAFLKKAISEVNVSVNWKC